MGFVAIQKLTSKTLLGSISLNDYLAGHDV